jgi:DNA-binding response OmpR family regulator
MQVHKWNGKKLTSEKLKVVIIEDDDDVRNFMVAAARFSGFDASGYSEVERVLFEIIRDPFKQNSMPDLFVVDLELKAGRLQGMALINELADRHIPSAVLAVSGNLPSENLLKAIKAGASATAIKPFDLIDLTKEMRRLADLGRKRRQYKASGKLDLTDPTRAHRLVFLSHSTQNKRTANGLVRKIEDTQIAVWYAPTTLKPGTDWFSELQSRIDQATVFIALITENYLSSPICVAEFNRFCERLESETANPPLLVPILYGDPSILNSNPLIKHQIEKYQWIRMSPERIVDAYTLILMTVQQAVKGFSVEYDDFEAELLLGEDDVKAG